MLRLNIVKERYDFEPMHDLLELEEYLCDGYNVPVLKDETLYDKIRDLTALAYPSEEDTIRDIEEKRWRKFYLPFRRRGYLIIAPMSIVLYDERFFLFFLNYQVEVIRGNIGSSFPSGLIEQTKEFCRIIKKVPEIISESIPKDIRTGKILGKYILADVLPLEEKARILRAYNDHIAKGLESKGVSLNDYLETTAICYRVAFGRKTKGLTPQQMRERWGDSRDCGMLEIKKPQSKEEFSAWLRHKSRCYGGHPFEIIFSMLSHSLHLYPPNEEQPFYRVAISKFGLSRVFIAVVECLIKEGIPFQAYSLDEVLAYLAGETWFAVNRYADNDIYYNNQEYRKILRHIVWDELEMLKWQ